MSLVLPMQGPAPITVRMRLFRRPCIGSGTPACAITGEWTTTMVCRPSRCVFSVCSVCVTVSKPRQKTFIQVKQVNSVQCWIYPNNAFIRSGKVTTFGYGHTWLKIPDPIRTRKSNSHGRRQYCGGGPRGNTACRNLFAFFTFDSLSNTFPL